MKCKNIYNSYFIAEMYILLNSNSYQEMTDIS